MSGWPYKLTCKSWGHSEYVEKLTSFSGDRSGGLKDPSERSFFRHPWNELKFFYSVPPSSLGCMPSFLSFLSLYEFSIIFSVKTAHSTPRTWHNMFLVFKYVQFLDWMSGWPYQLTCKSWGHSEYVKKLTSFFTDRSGRTEGPVLKEFFFDILQMNSIFL